MFRIFWTLVAVVVVFSAACNPTDEAAAQTPGEVVQSAAKAFVEGYSNRDLTQFRSFFATVQQGANAEGLIQTLESANTEVDKAQAGDQFQLQDFEIVSERIDPQNKEATVHYRATVSIVRNQTDAIFAALVEQDVALTRIDNKWLISGGDAPQITPNVSTTPPSSESGQNDAP